MIIDICVVYCLVDLTVSSPVTRSTDATTTMSKLARAECLKCKVPHYKRVNFYFGQGLALRGR